MRLIALHGREGIRAFAAVDDEDFARINAMRWQMTSDGYAVHSTKVGVGRKTIKVYMHKILIHASEQVDHINGNPRDNRKSNLRPATSAQNGCNKRPRAGHRPKGCVRLPSGRWCASITHRGVRHYLGSFESDAAAHAAYSEAAQLLHGEFARTA